MPYLAGFGAPGVLGWPTSSITGAPAAGSSPPFGDNRGGPPPPTIDPQTAAAAARNPARLSALREADLLDTGPDDAFDQLARLAARITDAPMAMVSLVDADRQVFKACFGALEGAPFGRETPLSHSFCQYAVASREPLLIEDARDHPVLRRSPAVTDHGLVAYAGVPLMTRDGHAIGTVCVLDAKPRPWRREDIAALQAVTSAVAAQISDRTTQRAAGRPAQSAPPIDKIVAAYVAALDEYDEAVSHDPGSLGFLAQEADLQANIIRRRADLQRLVDNGRDNVDFPVSTALKQHLECERRRRDASQAFAAVQVSLGDVETAVATAQAAETSFRSEWRDAQSVRA